MHYYFERLTNCDTNSIIKPAIIIGFINTVRHFLSFSYLKQLGIIRLKLSNQSLKFHSLLIAKHQSRMPFSPIKIRNRRFQHVAANDWHRIRIQHEVRVIINIICSAALTRPILVLIWLTRH